MMETKAFLLLVIKLVVAQQKLEINILMLLALQQQLVWRNQVVILS
jgi:hypothetical protein